MHKMPASLRTLFLRDFDMLVIVRVSEREGGRGRERETERERISAVFQCTKYQTTVTSSAGQQVYMLIFI